MDRRAHARGRAVGCSPLGSVLLLAPSLNVYQLNRFIQPICRRSSDGWRRARASRSPSPSPALATANGWRDSRLEPREAGQLLMCAHPSAPGPVSTPGTSQAASRVLVAARKRARGPAARRSRRARRSVLGCSSHPRSQTSTARLLGAQIVRPAGSFECSLRVALVYIRGIQRPTAAPAGPSRPQQTPTRAVCQTEGVPRAESPAPPRLASAVRPISAGLGGLAARLHLPLADADDFRNCPMGAEAGPPISLSPP
ncbi:hypothetical protein BCR34DRAFT_589667 [Clohesyomyces aquaticus]|uniref:Uncharacterized protein n=1 Tax=Clohesyomyces aquaticus TaxID=1231657 RepID=A0A1Y1ZG44_9PLEO|nr:hypothetical protein BCR34DRAFT_589667 [Clohesyomyces aquaticus]